MEPVYAEREGETAIFLKASYRDKELVKTIPGARWVAERSQWTVALSWPACHALRSIFGDRLEIGPALTDWANTDLKAWVEPARHLLTVDDVPGHEKEEAFQRIATEWLLTVKHGLLADEMRLGKTISSACALAVLRRRGSGPPVLVVCPNSVKRNWKRELTKWIPGITVSIVGGTAVQRRKALAEEADVYIVNWEALRLHSRLAPYGSIALNVKEKTDGELNRQWSVVIADECHRAKDPNAKQTRALWAASSKADYRWALTGTPIANHPGDLWSILHFLNPQEWPGKTRYVDRYCLQRFSPFGGIDIVGLNPANEAELRKTLDVRMLRRTQKEVGLYKPSDTIVRDVVLSPSERKRYNQMRQDLVTDLEGGEQVVAWNGLVKMVRLLQMSSATLVMGKEGEILLTDPSAKLIELMSTLDDLDPDPVVVVSPSRKLIQLAEQRIKKAFIPYGIIHGGIDTDTRDEHVEDFQEGRKRVMLLQSKAGGEGITLNRARTMIFLNRPTSLIEEQQVQARVTGYGQEADSILYIDLVTRDTVEERVFELLHEKGLRLEELVRDEQRLKELMA